VRDLKFHTRVGKHLIESIRQQKLEDIDIVIVNDGSTDSTQRIIDHYAKKDERIVPVQLIKNIGRSLARNRGIISAKSDIILISDADDVMNLERSNKTVDFFESNPDVGIVYGGFWVMDALDIRSLRRAKRVNKFFEAFGGKFVHIIILSLLVKRGGLLQLTHFLNDFRLK